MTSRPGPGRVSPNTSPTASGQKSGNVARPRHVPMRTCIVCRTNRPKRDLIRIVRSPEGAVTIDERGKHNGRGAYLCRQQTCWQAAFKRRALDHALHAPVPDEAKAMLEEYMAGLPEGNLTDPRSAGSAPAPESPHQKGGH